MPLIRSQNKIALFVHIPKTGGTSVESALKDAGAKVALLYGSRFNGFMQATFQHMHAEVYEKAIPSDFYDYSFTVVRHPVSRLVSEYFYRRKRGFAKRSFDEWTNIAIDQCTEKPHIMDNHFRPQCDFILPHIEVFRLEDGLDKPIVAAARALELTMPAARAHTNKRQTKAAVMWSAQTRARALTFYKKDFKKLGYDPNQVFDDLVVGDPTQGTVNAQAPASTDK